ncbi:MAG TPA: Fic family protein [Candidatus Nitrosotalea sp.]|nr:Fic family protein [Candidatus Nitrosotalea sp.]
MTLTKSYSKNVIGHNKQQSTNRHPPIEQHNLQKTLLWLEEEVCTHKRLSKVDISLLSEINTRLLNGVHYGSYGGGSFRNYDISIRNPIFHTTAHYTDIPKLLYSFLNSFYSVNFRQTPVIHRAAIIAANICKIHPYVDGNGRTSRLASLVLLLNEGYRYNTGKTLENFVEDNSFLWTRGIKFAIHGHYDEMIGFYRKMVTSLMHKTLPTKGGL